MKEKILILKQELFISPIGVLKNLNSFYEKSVRKHILNILKKNLKIRIIADSAFYSFLEKNKLKYLRISDYIPKKYENTYSEALNLFERWFSTSPLKKIKYMGYSFKEIIEQEFAYTITDYINSFNVIRYILDKEKPKKVFIVNDKTLFGKTCRELCNQKRIFLKSLISPVLSRSLELINLVSKKYGLNVRFVKIPFIKRREFVPIHKKKISNEKFILFNVFDDYYYNRLVPVIKEARSRKIKTKCIINNIDTQKRARINKEDFFSLGDFFKKSRESVKFKKELKKIKKEFIKTSKINKKLFEYKGLNIFPIIKDYFEYLFDIRFLWCAYYIEAYEALFNKNKVEAVMVMDDLIPLNRSLVLVSRKYDVPSLVAPHGVSIDSAGRGFYPVTADKMAAWGKIMKEQLIKKGVDKDKLEITGAYVYDKTIKKQRFRGDLYKKFGIKKNDFVILLATQKFDDIFSDKELEMILEATIKSLKKIKNAKLIITIHPRLEPYIHQAILKKYGLLGKILIDKKSDIDELISISDVLISLYSTIIFNAVLHEKPVISLNLMERPEIFPIVSSKTAIGVNQGKDLVNALQKTRNRKYQKLSGKYGKKFMKDYCYKMDGRSSKRVVDLIEKLMKIKNS